jgi:hypothetical protein
MGLFGKNSEFFNVKSFLTGFATNIKEILISSRILMVFVGSFIGSVLKLYGEEMRRVPSGVAVISDSYVGHYDPSSLSIPNVSIAIPCEHDEWNFRSRVSSAISSYTALFVRRLAIKASGRNEISIDWTEISHYENNWWENFQKEKLLLRVYNFGLSGIVKFNSMLCFGLFIISIIKKWKNIQNISGQSLAFSRIRVMQQENYILFSISRKTITEIYSIYYFASINQTSKWIRSIIQYGYVIMDCIENYILSIMGWESIILELIMALLKIICLCINQTRRCMKKLVSDKVVKDFIVLA